MLPKFPPETEFHVRNDCEIHGNNVPHEVKFKTWNNKSHKCTVDLRCCACMREADASGGTLYYEVVTFLTKEYLHWVDEFVCEKPKFLK